MESLELPKRDREVLGHPVGLYIMFLTELWERFSFYGMKALLIFYLTKYHLFTDDAGYLLIGSYAALVYAMPVIGGYVADKYLGFRKAIIFGAILLVFGHLGLAYEGTQAYKLPDETIQQDNFALQVFYFSLAFIIMGVGFLKANISSIVGELYAVGDKRRDSGFTIFYMGINLGAFLATIVCVWLGETYGWGYGFGAAGVGMLLGLLTFIKGRPYYEGKGEPPNPSLLEKSVFGLKLEYFIYVVTILSIAIIWQMVQKHHVVEWILIIGIVFSFIAIIYFAISQPDKVVRDRLLALLLLIIFTIFFWALFEQAYSSLNLFADRVINLNVLGIDLKAGYFLSLNSLFIISLAPLFAWLWVKMGKYNPNTAVKFAFALILVGSGFGFLVLGIEISGAAKVAPFFLVLTYLFHTMGELCLSPVGLSAVTKLSPGRIVGFMMGVWFLATAASEYLAVILAKLASINSVGEIVDLEVAKTAYLDLFSLLFYIGIACGLFLLALSPVIKRLMHGVDRELNV
jgi:proton-dependent oligopeptide transporter, POT family